MSDQTETIYHPIEEDHPNRALMEHVTCDHCRESGDWAGVVVHVVEPWLGPDVTPDVVVPGELAKVTVVEGGGYVGVRLEFMRHEGVPGVAGRIVVEALSADEAFHLGCLLRKAALKALELDPDA